MMMNAYSELYLDDAMHNLADMIEHAVCECNYDPDSFFNWFISSGIAEKFEKGNPKYITGMSGIELAENVLKTTNITINTDSTEIKSTAELIKQLSQLKNP